MQIIGYTTETKVDPTGSHSWKMEFERQFPLPLNPRESESFDNRLRIMYFQTSFSVPLLKHFASRFLHHREATRSCCRSPDICCRSCLGC